MSHQPDVAYVVSEYPAISHTFILREVQALRALGVGVVTFSIHRTEESALLSSVDVKEAESTVNLLPVGALTFLRVHAGLLARYPKAYVSALVHALRVSQGGMRAHLWQVFYFAEAGLLFHQCRRRNVRRLHAHFANVAADVCLLTADLGRRIEPASGWSWSFTMHGSTEFFDVDRFNLRRKIQEADLVICISDFCRSQMMWLSDETHWYKLRVGHCGVDTEELGPVDRSSRGQQPVEVVCISRLIPGKGHVLLLEAVRRLLAAGRVTRLVLVGDGPLRSSLEAKAAELGIMEHVEFLGAVGHDRLPELLERADIFCLPSFAEGLPVVLMEAMARNIPVVTTPIGAVTELVHDGINGILVPPGRVDLLVTALTRLADDGDLRVRLGQQGRITVEAEFSLPDCARRVSELLGVTG